MPFKFNVRRSLGAGLIPGGGGAILKPQDVFATSLYTGDTTASPLVNGLDLAGFGGLVWEKPRNQAIGHYLADTLRGGTKYLASELPDAEQTNSSIISQFNSNGYNRSRFGAAVNIASWAFRRAAKFFDIVTWTGDGTSNRLIPHGLGVVPGMIVTKNRDAVFQWLTTHRSLPNPFNDFLYLNLTNANNTGDGSSFNGASSSTFTVGAGGGTNTAGQRYVAYLIAHDPSADGIVQCVPFTADANGAATVNLGWQPQYGMFKTTSTTSPWYICDAARGFTSSNNPTLLANTSGAENASTPVYQYATATGVVFNNTALVANSTNVGMFIRAPY